MLEAVFLYIMFHDDNTNYEKFRVQMPSFEVCYEAVERGKIAHPHKTGADYEVMGVMFCGGGTFQAQAGEKWYEKEVE
jgi:hypothetical protein